MLRVDIRLAAYYGADFPNFCEVDHLIALRGYLIMLIKQARERNDGDLHRRIQASIDHIESMLERDYRVNTDRRLEAPRELFEHYMFVVAKNWRALRDLRP